MTKAFFDILKNSVFSLYFVKNGVKIGFFNSFLSLLKKNKHVIPKSFGHVVDMPFLTMYAKFQTISSIALLKLCFPVDPFNRKSILEIIPEMLFVIKDTFY